MSIPAPANLRGRPDTPDPTASKRALPLNAMLLGSLGFAAHSTKAADLEIPFELPGLNVDNPVVERIKNAKATVTPR